MNDPGVVFSPAILPVCSGLLMVDFAFKHSWHVKSLIVLLFMIQFSLSHIAAKEFLGVRKIIINQESHF